MAVSDLRWAARLAFCEELWRDRARIVWDRRIEAVLAASVNEPDEDDPLARLVDAVVPRRAVLDGARKRIDVSMGVGEEPIARRLAPRRPPAPRPIRSRWRSSSDSSMCRCMR